MSYREAALARIEIAKQQSKDFMEQLQAPSRAIEFLFGVTESQMRECILKAREAGRNDTTQIVLPPLVGDDSVECYEHLKTLFGEEPQDRTQLGGKGMVMSYRGHKLVIGEKLEVV